MFIDLIYFRFFMKLLWRLKLNAYIRIVITFKNINMNSTSYTSTTWKDYYGNTYKLSDLSDSHIINIIMYNQFFFNLTQDNSEFMSNLSLILINRIGPIDNIMWKPLPIPMELESLKLLGNLNKSGQIIGNRNCGIREGLVIGSITHLENWEQYV